MSDTNGTPPTNGHVDDPTGGPGVTRIPVLPQSLSDRERELALNSLERRLARHDDLVENFYQFSRAWIGQQIDPRRNLFAECGYPEEPTIDMYRNLYEREPLATRAVEVYPKECWQQPPTVFEDMDVDTVTDFEEAWDNLTNNLRTEFSYYQDEQGSAIWDELQRADILSRIGSYGVILLGIDDGKNLQEPLDGVMVLNEMLRTKLHDSPMTPEEEHRMLHPHGRWSATDVDGLEQKQLIHSGPDRVGESPLSVNQREQLEMWRWEREYHERGMSAELAVNTAKKRMERKKRQVDVEHVNPCPHCKQGWPVDADPKDNDGRCPNCSKQVPIADLVDNVKSSYTEVWAKSPQQAAKLVQNQVCMERGWWPKILKVSRLQRTTVEGVAGNEREPEWIGDDNGRTENQQRGIGATGSRRRSDAPSCNNQCPTQNETVYQSAEGKTERQEVRNANPAHWDGDVVINDLGNYDSRDATRTRGHRNPNADEQAPTGRAKPLNPNQRNPVQDVPVRVVPVDGGAIKPGQRQTFDPTKGPAQRQGDFAEVFGTDQQYDDEGYGIGMPPPAAELGYSLSGTDEQYFGVQFGPSEQPAPPTDPATAWPAGDQTTHDQDGRPQQPKRLRPRLLFMRPYSEDLVQVVRYEWNIRNPRFGYPVMYRITLNDPRETQGGVGLPLATVFVHWSRVIHLCDRTKCGGVSSNPVFTIPALKPVFNSILDAQKVCGGGAEGYWKSCFTGLQFVTHPSMGGDVMIDENSTRAQLEQYQNNLTRGMLSIGGEWKTIAPQVIDPTPHYNLAVEKICIVLGCPVRIFKGSERGELASSQDDESWNKRRLERQVNYLTPRVIVPLIDRLIQVGVLPVPGQKSGKQQVQNILKRQPQAKASRINGGWLVTNVFKRVKQVRNDNPNHDELGRFAGDSEGRPFHLPYSRLNLEMKMPYGTQEQRESGVLTVYKNASKDQLRNVLKHTDQDEIAIKGMVDFDGNSYAWEVPLGSEGVNHQRLSEHLGVTISNSMRYYVEADKHGEPIISTHAGKDASDRVVKWAKSQDLTVNIVSPSVGDHASRVAQALAMDKDNMQRPFEAHDQQARTGQAGGPDAWSNPLTGPDGEPLDDEFERPPVKAEPTENQCRRCKGSGLEESMDDGRGGVEFETCGKCGGSGKLIGNSPSQEQHWDGTPVVNAKPKQKRAPSIAGSGDATPSNDYTSQPDSIGPADPASTEVQPGNFPHDSPRLNPGYDPPETGFSHTTGAAKPTNGSNAGPAESKSRFENTSRYGASGNANTDDNAATDTGGGWEPPTSSDDADGGAAPWETGQTGIMAGAGKPSSIFVSDGGYSVEWPDIEAVSKKDKAAIALQYTQALQAYVQGGVEATMPFKEYLVHIWGWEEELAQEMIDAAKALHDPDGDDAPLTQPKNIAGQPAEAADGTQAAADADQKAQADKDKADAMKQSLAMKSKMGAFGGGGSKLPKPGAIPPPNKQDAKIAAVAKSQAANPPKDAE